MAGYTPPSGPGAPGGQGGPAGYPAPAAGSGRAALPLYEIIGAGIGVLTWIWGFLKWFGSGDQGIKGFGGFGTAVIALALAASGVGLAGLVVKNNEKSVVELRQYTAAGLAAAAVLVSFGMLIGHGDEFGDAKIGLILALITSLLQTAAFTAAFLESKGVIPKLTGGAKPAQYAGYPQQGYQQGAGYQQQGGYQQPQGYQAPPAAQAPPQGGYQSPQSPQTPRRPRPPRLRRAISRRPPVSPASRVRTHSRTRAGSSS